MNARLEPGTYVVAVSGGVDSMALLDLLRRQPRLRLVVAHYDHGIRHDSVIDRALVQSVARKHGLPFVFEAGKLGPGTSEAAARKARYDFLKRVQKASNADAIVTAHHQDDVIETSIINLIRGTGRKGVSSLHSREDIRRPLLKHPKTEIKKYASEQGLHWREDSTNNDTKLLRNHVRHTISSKMTPAQRLEFLYRIYVAHDINQKLDAHLVNHLHTQPALDRLNRHTFICLPHRVAKEVLAHWLRRHGIRQFDSKTLERLVVAAKTYAPNKTADINMDWSLRVGKKDLALAHTDR